MHNQEIIKKIRDGFRDAFGTDPSLVTADSKPEDIPGWDSLGHAVLTSCLEKKFNITFDIDELMAMEDVSSIIQILETRG